MIAIPPHKMGATILRFIYIRGTCTNTEAVGHLEVMRQLMIYDALGYSDNEEEV